MTRINPEILRRRRLEKRWTQNDLARKSGVDTQTISRLERGQPAKTRKRTVEQLAKALQIEEAALTAERALPSDASIEPAWAEKSQASYRISNACRNALALVTLRYGVKAAQIVELAPFLFASAAERSLSIRRVQVRQIDLKYDELEECRPEGFHLSALVTSHWQAYEILRAEEESIAKRDIFGGTLEVSSFEGELREDFEEGVDNPMVVFLRSLAKEIGNKAEFEGWYPSVSPEYKICAEEAVSLVNGDLELAEEILSGHAPLHEVPKELWHESQVSDRLKKIRSLADECRKRIDKETNELLELLKVKS